MRSHTRNPHNPHGTASRFVRLVPGTVPLQVRVTLFEIYNEQVRDLLVDPKLQATVPPLLANISNLCRPTVPPPCREVRLPM